MASVHAAPLIALAMLAAPVADAAPAVTLTLGSDPGVVVVTNRSARDQWLTRTMLVEQRVHGGWQVVEDELDLVAECDARFPRRTQPVRLRRHQVVTVVGWTGYTCDKQCAATCHFNTYQGGGRFRIVARAWPGGERFASPVFTMPFTPTERRSYAGPTTYETMVAESRRPRAGPNDP